MKESIVGVILAIVGVAVIAIIVSPNSNSSSVIGAGGNSFSNAIKCAMAPITGGVCASSNQLTSVTSTFTAL
jgi:hypothetical protein